MSIQDQLAFRLSQQHAEVQRLEGELVSARQRYDAECVRAARLPAGETDARANDEDVNVKNYTRRLHGARLLLAELEREQSVEGFAERVQHADKLLADIADTSPGALFQGQFGETLEEIGAQLAATYLAMLESLTTRQQQVAKASEACAAVGAPLDSQETFHLMGSVDNVDAVFGRALWHGITNAVRPHRNVGVADILTLLAGAMRKRFDA